MEHNIIKRKADLMLKYLRDGLSGEEQKEFDQWIAASGENRALVEKLMESSQLKKALADYAGNKTKTWEQIRFLLLHHL